MDVDNVRILLTRYYEGATSQDEERMLAEYFAAADVPADLMPEKELFAHLAAGCEQVPDGLGERLELVIDRLDMAERMATRRRWIPRWTRTAGVAASVAILFVAGFVVVNNRGGVAAHNTEDTCQSPQEAYAYAQEALIRISTALNRGDESAVRAERLVSGAMEKVERHITIN